MVHAHKQHHALACREHELRLQALGEEVETLGFDQLGDRLATLRLLSQDDNLERVGDEARDDA